MNIEADKKELKAERLATYSSCCGFLGEVTLTDSAVIILFAGMLGAGDMLSMITTSVLPFLNGIFLIPMAYLATKIGTRRLIMTACISASFAYFAAVASPFFGTAKVAVLLTAVTLFAFCLTGFIASWFPMLDTFLAKERRTLFFSRMRFSHQLTATIFLFAVGLSIGKTPSLQTLQLVLLLGGVIFIGRAFFISRIPRFEPLCKDQSGFRKGLADAVCNKSLTCFSLYLFVINLLTFGTVPLMMLYLKNKLGAPDNIVILVSSASLFGMLLGYICINPLIKKIRIRFAFPLFHVIFLLVNLSLFFISTGGMTTYILIAVLLMIYSLTIAASSIVASAEMMKLASQGNKIISMAFSGTLSCGASGLSRLIASLFLGTGLLAAEWQLCGMKLCSYQTILLIYTVSIALSSVFLTVVPAVFPKGEYVYQEH